jgi:uncharacterized membrane protein
MQIAEQLQSTYLGILVIVWLIVLATTVFVPIQRIRLPGSVRKRRFLQSDKSTHYFLAGLLLLFVAAYVWLSLTRHARFNSTGYDLAINEQIIWNTLHGRFFSSSLEVDNAFADHFQPILLFVVPVYALFQRTESILILQVLVLASASIPIYMLAKLKTDDRVIALAISAIYLVYPAVGFISRFDFHPEVFAIPAFVAAFYMMEKGRWRWASVWLVVPLLTKENMGLIVAMVGVYSLIRWKRWRWGVSWLAIGLFAFFATSFWLLPSVRGETLDAFDRYHWLGASPGEMLRTLITNPRLALDHIISAGNGVYILQLLLPLGFMSLLGLPELLIALPIIGANLLADHFCQPTIYCHYAAPIVPLVFISAIAGLSRLKNRMKDDIKLRVIAVLLLPVALAAFLIVNPFREQRILPSALQRIGNPEVVRQALATVPDEVSVVTTNDYAAHLARREGLFIIGLPSQRDAPVDPEVVFLNLYDQQYIVCDQFLGYLSRLDEDAYGVIFRTGGVIVIQRGAGSNEEFKEFIGNWNNCAG